MFAWRLLIHLIHGVDDVIDHVGKEPDVIKYTDDGEVIGDEVKGAEDVEQCCDNQRLLGEADFLLAEKSQELPTTVNEEIALCLLVALGWFHDPRD